jgi:hypothetical protein
MPPCSTWIVTASGDIAPGGEQAQAARHHLRGAIGKAHMGIEIGHGMGGNAALPRCRARRCASATSQARLKGGPGRGADRRQ